MNNRGKRLIIRGCLNKWKPYAVCPQEKKVEDFSKWMIESLWSVKDKDWNVIPVKSTAGELIILWKEEQVNCVKVIKGECTLSCIFNLGGA